MDHDLIFYEVYSRSKKLSLTTVLGRKNALYASALISALSNLLLIAYVAARLLPIWCIAAPIVSAALLLRKRKDFTKFDEPPPFYVPFTVNALYSDWLFSLVLAIGILL
jgi:1,4-dihydroxy-2-naphthoate octaprenyltransferase